MGRERKKTKKSRKIAHLEGDGPGVWAENEMDMTEGRDNIKREERVKRSYGKNDEADKQSVGGSKQNGRNLYYSEESRMAQNNVYRK